MTEWRSISGYEGFYEVSSDGQVRGCKRVVGAANGKAKVIKPKLLKPTVMQPSRHLTVELRKNGVRRRFLVHRLVLTAFEGAPLAGTEGCHRNGSPQDNRIENLYWGTRSENMLDAVAHGTHRWARRTHCERGHEFTPENTRPRSNGSGRECIECAQIWMQRKIANRRNAS